MSKEIASTFFAQSDNELAQYFTDTEAITNKLQDFILQENPGQKNIFAIRGTAAVGKSTVLRMFRRFCKENHIPVALVSATDFNTPIEMLEMLSKDFFKDDAELKSFNKTLRDYKGIVDDLENAVAQENRKRLQDAGQKIIGSAADALAEVTPFGKPLVMMGGGIFDCVRAYLNKTNDFDLYMNARTRLTDDFISDIEDVASKNRVVLMLDTYESLLGGEVDRWFCDFLRQLPPNSMVVVAGRKALGNPAWFEWWPGWAIRVSPEELPKMEEEDVRTLVEKYYRLLSGGEAPSVSQEEHEAQVQKIVRWTRGDLLAVTTAVKLWVDHRYSFFDFDDVIPDVLRTVVNSLMKGTSETLQKVLEAAATVRWFNKDVLGALLNRQEIEDTFNELIRWNFVRPVKDAWCVEELIRKRINDKLRIEDMARYKDLHERACQFFAEKVRADSKSAEQSRRFNLEKMYHEFQLDEERGLDFFRRAFEEAFFQRRQFDFCSAILNDMAKYALGESSKEWRLYYTALMEVYASTDPDRPRKALEELLGRRTLNRQLKANVLEYLAAIYWFYFLREKGATEKAERLYKEALNLRSVDPNDTAGQARVWVWLGVLHQRTKGKGESEFKQAIKLLSRLESEDLRIRTWRAWTEQELSIVYRMQGLFRDSQDLIERSIEEFSAIRSPFDEAGARFNYAMLLIYQGDLVSAESQLQLSRILYNDDNSLRILERAWPLVGLGDVALNRGLYDEAAGFYSQVYEMGNSAGDLFVRSLGLGGLSSTKIGTRDFRGAIECADTCFDIQARIKDKFGMGWTLNTKGCALLKLDNLEDALVCFQEGLTHMQEYGSYWGISKLELGACEVYLHEGRNHEFDLAAKTVESFATKYGYREQLAKLRLLTGKKIMKFAGGANGVKEELTQEAAQVFVDALFFALNYNIHFLDVVLQDICDFVRESMSAGWYGESVREKLISLIADSWMRKSDGKDSVVNIENLRRTSEDVDNKHQDSVLEVLSRMRNIS